MITSQKINFMKIRKFLLLSSMAWCMTPVFAQDVHKIISEETVQRLVSTLASDAMQGRKIFTPYIDSAAAFIASEFENAGLKKWNQSEDYFQNFHLQKAELLRASGSINQKEIEASNIIPVSTKTSLTLNEQSGYRFIQMESGKNLLREAYGIVQENKNTLVQIPTSYASEFNRIKRLNRSGFESAHDVLFVLSDAEFSTYQFQIEQRIEKSPLNNVIGYLPGKSKPNEYVVFSAHYDHLGIGKPNEAGDSIYNGANDNATGTTAVMMLAKYFGSLQNNERSILFVAFTGEESGGFGSRYFSSQLNPDDVVAMFNIEMIGTESKWGKNSVYITGFEKSDFGSILQKNVVGSEFRFEPDPYPQQQLFYRSDNATLAALGVPAHSISTAKMENEKYYHTADDEIENIDIPNMTSIIKAILLSSTSIIQAKDTPSRVEALER